MSSEWHLKHLSDCENSSQKMIQDQLKMSFVASTDIVIDEIAYLVIPSLDGVLNTALLNFYLHFHYFLLT
jgi:hypothetical protein